MRLKLLSALSLIALTLTLTGAAGIEVAAQENPHRATENSSQKPVYDHQHLESAHHAAKEDNAVGAEAGATRAIKSSHDPYRFLSETGRIVSSQVFFNTLLTVATILIAMFNFQLLFLTRPLLVADRPTPRFFSPREWDEARAEGKVFLLTSANCPFRNVGQSPAIILKIFVRMKLGADLPPPPTFQDCKEETAFKDSVVPAGASSDFYAIYEGNKFSEEEWKMIFDQKSKVLLYGRIEYRGVLWWKYTMTFGCVYVPPHSGFGEGNVFRFGHREYNIVARNIGLSAIGRRKRL